MPDTKFTDTIRSVLADVGRLDRSVSELADDSNLFEVGLTSHATVNIMLELEDRFDIEFAEHLLKRSTFESIASLDDAIRESMAT